MVKESEVLLASEIISDYILKYNMTMSEKEIKILSENLVNISYSIGGFPSKEILENMVVPFMTTTAKNLLK